MHSRRRWYIFFLRWRNEKWKWIMKEDVVSRVFVLFLFLILFYINTLVRTYVHWYRDWLLKLMWCCKYNMFFALSFWEFYPHDSYNILNIKTEMDLVFVVLFLYFFLCLLCIYICTYIKKYVLILWLRSKCLNWNEWLLFIYCPVSSCCYSYEFWICVFKYYTHIASLQLPALTAYSISGTVVQ